MSSRVDGGWFGGTEIADLFEALRLPRPAQISNELSRLSLEGRVIRKRSGAKWSLTPEGKEAVTDLLEGLDVQAVETEITALGGAEFDDSRQPVLPPQLAPVRWAGSIAALLDDYPFEQNVFLMTRFPKSSKEDELPDPVQQVIETTRSTLGQFGLHLHLASDRQADDELFGNIAAHMWACKYGIGLFETRYSTDFNDNLQIEVGAMLMTGRRTALLKDAEAEQVMPTDLVGQIYKSVFFEDLEAVARALEGWVTDDLRLA